MSDDGNDRWDGTVCYPLTAERMLEAERQIWNSGYIKPAPAKVGPMVQPVTEEQLREAQDQVADLAREETRARDQLAEAKRRLDLARERLKELQDRKRVLHG